MEGRDGFPGRGNGALQIPCRGAAMGILLVLPDVKQTQCETAEPAALRKPSNYLLSVLKRKKARWEQGEGGAERRVMPSNKN